ncbi:methionine/alanine import family NSS transporter small subunit [Rodentibacter caecimuris]
MSNIAITMMIIALVVIWGGLIYSIWRLPEDQSR